MQQDRRRGQKNIFDAFGENDEAAPPPSEGLAEVPDWPPSERLKHEKEALDFYFSSHPLAEHANELRRFASHTVAQLKKAQHGQRVLIGGMLTQVRFMDVKRSRERQHALRPLQDRGLYRPTRSDDVAG